MTTKAEELNIINKIEALINSTEDGSYTRTTFEGVCDLARKNVEWDAAFTPAGEAEAEAEALRQEVRELTTRTAAAEAKVEAAATARAAELKEQEQELRRAYSNREFTLENALRDAAHLLEQVRDDLLTQAATAAAAHDLDRLQTLTAKAIAIDEGIAEARKTATATA